MVYGARSEAALAMLKYYKESQSSFIAGRESSTKRLHPQSLKPYSDRVEMQQILAHDLAKLPKTDQVQGTTTLFCFHERHCIVAYGM